MDGDLEMCNEMDSVEFKLKKSLFSHIKSGESLLDLFCFQRLGICDQL
ncbi:hypothetical protein TOT_010000499 [Theileria orientalis strain Shintoku]|uniref:Uncharacterized protein n=1 Tax=Theileria orientalis strain Shintoku TaxID=869250 RepID=J4C2P2_THEOR|nr:hypothetical protein TOT_010000499 [Theileria orientalis strain Shintoku]BAM39036.1 hypothetical protein TOT_010000499 [Theileria orientalis strain Shintoku]|eukprot:XP_009689337.1 hypothetical protein TOT_010000499 [Theileria orientalis strain Shintoku]